MLTFTPQEIIDSINQGFAIVYRPFAKFKQDSPEVWDRCIQSIKDTQLLQTIIFCNDNFQIPPVDTQFAAIKNWNYQLSDFEKKAIGGFWGYVFKNIFQYAKQKQRLAKSPLFRYATYFAEPADEITIMYGFQ